MACGCIDEIDAMMTDHRLDTSIVITEGGLASRAYAALIRRDTGTRETRRTKPTIFTATFCPFCGVRYDPVAGS